MQRDYCAVCPARAESLTRSNISPPASQAIPEGVQNILCNIANGDTEGDGQPPMRGSIPVYGTQPATICQQVLMPAENIAVVGQRIMVWQ